MAKLLHIFYHKEGTFSLLCQQVLQLPVPSNKIGGDGVKDYEEVLEERRKRINKPRQVIKDEYVEDDFFSIDDDDNLDFPEDWK